jgi:hypothetical protein
LISVDKFHGACFFGAKLSGDKLQAEIQIVQLIKSIEQIDENFLNDYLLRMRKLLVIFMKSLCPAVGEGQAP